MKPAVLQNIPEHGSASACAMLRLPPNGMAESRLVDGRGLLQSHCLCWDSPPVLVASI